jgi:hypothetical protein
MRTALNHTELSGRLLSCKAAADGFGGELEIEVAANESRKPELDFIKPAPGQRLRVFHGDFKPEQEDWVGHEVKLTLTLLGGPGGERLVVQTLKKKQP